MLSRFFKLGISFSNMCSRKLSRISIVQMTSTKEKEKNLLFCLSCIENAKLDGSEMVFLPEAFDFIEENSALSLQKAELLNCDTIKAYQSIAKSLNMWISLGGFHQKIPDQDKIFNTHVIIDNTGNIKSTYYKTHLFDANFEDGNFFYESANVQKGDAIGPPVETPVGMIGLAICYDLRFPQLSLSLSQQGANIITYPSAFTQVTGKAHWHTLLKARAIENQCFVIAAAQVGKHNDKRTSYGHSLVVNPWGDILLDMEEEVGVKSVDLDLSKVFRVRSSMPLEKHKRMDLYPSFNIFQHSNTMLNKTISMKFGLNIDIPGNHIFYINEQIFSFVNISPIVPGHVLVCPCRLVSRLADLNLSETTALFHAVQEISTKLQFFYKSTAVTLGLQDGRDAGQTVDHVHLHILPRQKGDFENNDAIYQELQQHDKQPTRKKRSYEIMAEEALQLRTLFV